MYVCKFIHVFSHFASFLYFFGVPLNASNVFFALYLSLVSHIESSSMSIWGEFAGGKNAVAISKWRMVSNVRISLITVSTKNI